MTSRSDIVGTRGVSNNKVSAQERNEVVSESHNSVVVNVLFYILKKLRIRCCAGDSALDKPVKPATTTTCSLPGGVYRRYELPGDYTLGASKRKQPSIVIRDPPIRSSGAAAAPVNQTDSLTNNVQSVEKINNIRSSSKQHCTQRKGSPVKEQPSRIVLRKADISGNDFSQNVFNTDVKSVGGFSSDDVLRLTRGESRRRTSRGSSSRGTNQASLADSGFVSACTTIHANDVPVALVRRTDHCDIKKLSESSHHNPIPSTSSGSREQKHEAAFKSLRTRAVIAPPLSVPGMQSFVPPFCRTTAQCRRRRPPSSKAGSKTGSKTCSDTTWASSNTRRRRKRRGKRRSDQGSNQGFATTVHYCREKHLTPCVSTFRRRQRQYQRRIQRAAAISSCRRTYVRNWLCINDDAKQLGIMADFSFKRDILLRVAKERASVLWLLSKAYNNRVPDEFQDPYYRDYEDQCRLKPQISQGLASGELYCLALANIYADPNYHSLSHVGIINILQRKGVEVMSPPDHHNSLNETTLTQTAPLRMAAHMCVVEAIMELYIKEVLIPVKVFEVVRRFSPHGLPDELPADSEDAALLWLNRAAIKLRHRIERDSSHAEPLPSIRPCQDLADLSDGCALTSLLSYYCPDYLPWEEISFMDPMNLTDSLCNLQLAQRFCVQNLPHHVCFLTLEDLLFMHASIRPNMLAFLADLMYLFEIRPAKCVVKPVYGEEEMNDDEAHEVSYQDELQYNYSLRKARALQNSCSHIPDLMYDAETVRTQNNASHNGAWQPPPSPAATAPPYPTRRSASSATLDRGGSRAHSGGGKHRQHHVTSPYADSGRNASEEDDDDDLSGDFTHHRYSVAPHDGGGGGLQRYGSTSALSGSTPATHQPTRKPHRTSREEPDGGEYILRAQSRRPSVTNTTPHERSPPLRRSHSRGELSRSRQDLSSSNNPLGQGGYLQRTTSRGDLSTAGGQLNRSTSRTSLVGGGHDANDMRSGDGLEGYFSQLSTVDGDAPRSPLRRVLSQSHLRDFSGENAAQQMMDPEAIDMFAGHREKQQHATTSFAQLVRSESASDQPHKAINIVYNNNNNSNGGNGMHPLRHSESADSRRHTTTTWLQQATSSPGSPSGAGDSSSNADEDLSSVRRQLEERRSKIEQEKRKAEQEIKRERQQVGKAAFLQAVVSRNGTDTGNGTSKERGTPSPPQQQQQHSSSSTTKQQQQHNNESQQQQHHSRDPAERITKQEQALQSMIHGGGTGGNNANDVNNSFAANNTFFLHGSSNQQQQQQQLHLQQQQQQQASVAAAMMHQQQQQHQPSPPMRRQWAAPTQVLVHGDQGFVEQPVSMGYFAGPAPMQTYWRPVMNASPGPMMFPQQHGYMSMAYHQDGHYMNMPPNIPQPHNGGMYEQQQGNAYRDESAARKQQQQQQQQQSNANHVTSDASSGQQQQQQPGSPLRDRNPEFGKTFRLPRNASLSLEDEGVSTNGARRSGESSLSSGGEEPANGATNNDDTANGGGDKGGFFVAFGDEPAKKPKPPKMRPRILPKMEGSNEAGHNMTFSTDGNNKRMEQQKATSDASATTVFKKPRPSDEQHSGVGFVIPVDDVKTEEEAELQRKKEMVMMMSLRRRQEQEQQRLLKQQLYQKKQQQEQAKREEQERKREEERLRREAILQQYRERKALEEAQERGEAPPGGSGAGAGTLQRRPKSRSASATRPRPTTIHVDNRTAAGLPSFGGARSSLGMGAGQSIRDGADRGEGMRRAPSPPDSLLTAGGSRRPPSDGASDTASTTSSLFPSSHLAEYQGPKLFVKPTAKSNRTIIMNALNTVLAGAVNADTKTKAIMEIGRSDSKHFLILFRGQNLQFRGLYAYNPDREDVIKLFGTGPRVITSDMMDLFYKYNSGSKSFTQIHTKHLTATIDAVTIQNSLWSGRRPAVPVKRELF